MTKSPTDKLFSLLAEVSRLNKEQLSVFQEDCAERLADNISASWAEVEAVEAMISYANSIIERKSVDEDFSDDDDDGEEDSDSWEF